uniref:Uncharacterized protein n=1 Tax=Prevotella sp. GTC17253 TaxID=3236793 RepID=A0AB33IRL4_9BACT
MPIGISYHSSGIKVNDIASQIGLGWTLNAGGVLSVEVRGNNMDDYTEPEILTEQEVEERRDGKKYPYFFNTMLGYSDGKVDTQSDKYSYTVAGSISGNFVKDNHNNIIQLPATDRKIFIKNKTYYILDEDGTRYEFGAGNYTLTKNAEGRLITAYHLTKIVSADKTDSMLFHYRQVPNYYLSQVHFVGRKCNDYNMVAPSSYYDNIKTYSLCTYSDVILSSIVFQGGDIEFVSTDDRDDLGKGKITDINICQQTDKLSHAKIITCHLEQSYFISDNLQEKYAPYYKRLRLDKLELQVNDNTRTYSFDYNRIKLPNYDFGAEQRNSWPIGEANVNYGQDMWGYYNGVTSNRHLIPFSMEVPKGDFLKMTDCSQLPQRKVSPSHSKACMLSRIHYPSGGYTEFEYESNRVGHEGTLCGGMRIKEIISYDRNSKMLKKKSYSYGAGEDITLTQFLGQSSVYSQKYRYTGSLLLGSPQNAPINTETFICTSSPALLNTTYSSPVFYPFVTEYEGDEKNNTGKTEYSYNYVPNRVFPNMSRSGSTRRYKWNVIDNFWMRGDLCDLKKYKNIDGKYTLVKSEAHHYAFPNTKEVITGLVVTHDVVDYYDYHGMQARIEDMNKWFDWFNTKTQAGSKVLIHSIFYDCLSEGKKPVTKEILYEYGKISATHSHQQLTQKIERLGQSACVSTKYFYPQDVTLNTVSGADYGVNCKFRELNILNQPIEILVRRAVGTSSFQLVSGVFLHFEDIGRIGKVYSLKIPCNADYTGITQLSHAGYNKSNNYDLEIANVYDAKKNIVESTDRDGIPTTILWGYGGRMPVAYIRNANFSAVSTKLQQYTGFTPKSLLTSYNLDLSKLGVLRRELPKAHVQLFKHASLLGLTDIVNENGIQVHYDYDGFGRLVFTALNGKPFHAYSYHEDSQNADALILHTTSEYQQFREAVFSVDVTGNEDDYHYTWKILDSKGTTLVENTGNPFRVMLKKWGEEISLICDVTGKRTLHLVRKIHTVPAPVMKVSEIISTDSVIRVDGRKYGFSIHAQDGSGQYSFRWTLKYGTVTKTFDTPDIEFSADNTYTGMLLCEVTDKEYGTKVMRSYSIKVLPPLPLQLEGISGHTTYAVGMETSYTPIVEPGTGSGNYLCTWRLKAPSGQVSNKSSNPSKPNQFNFIFPDYGTYQLTCILTDNFTKKTYEATTIIHIRPTVNFVEESTKRGMIEQEITGYIRCDRDVTLKIEYGTDRPANPKDDRAQFSIGGNYFDLFTGTEEREITLKKGKSSFNIFVTKQRDNNRVMEFWIKILSVSPDCLILNDIVRLVVL